jgi:glycogen(starch) synthase
LFQVVLFDIGSVYHKLNKWKAEFWEAVRIGLPEGDKESNDALVLGYLVAQFISEVSLDCGLVVNLVN